MLFLSPLVPGTICQSHMAKHVYGNDPVSVRSVLSNLAILVFTVSGSSFVVEMHFYIDLRLMTYEKCSWIFTQPFSFHFRYWLAGILKSLEKKQIIISELRAGLLSSPSLLAKNCSARDGGTSHPVY